MQTKPTVITLMGPTASGKTALAIELHQRLGAEIISVDSALIYQGMDIGTAKPNAHELALAPHRLIDICQPNEIYSAADFRRDALEQIEQVLAKGKIPLLVGGTMLYFKALVEGIANLPEADSELRAQLQAQGEKEGWNKLHQQLHDVDPISAARINVNDQQRLIRALEVYLLSGKSLSELTSEALPEQPYNFMQYAIAPAQREQLHARIELRFDQMLRQGFADEVKALMQRGDLDLSYPSMRSVGYRQMWQYLNDEINYDEMRYRGIVATRQLAKKQMTWLRTWPNLTWLDSEQPENHKIIINSLS